MASDVSKYTVKDAIADQAYKESQEYNEKV